MALKSMTGFASCEGTLEVAGQVYQWTWEVKAVNGKALDMRMRLPHLIQSCEPAVRKLLGKKITRGNLQANLSLEH
ncbi:MAG: YicC/YloC family endoribonuclease, partial [Hyphomicrobiales bacterium]